MKIVIYGNGNFGKRINNCISKSKDIEVVGFIDNYKSDGDMKVWTLNEFLEERIQVDYVILAMINQRTNTNELLIPLLRSKYKIKYVPNFYWHYDIPLKQGKEFINEDCVSYEDIAIQYIEMHVQDNCNLNCKGCTHFSPFFAHDSVVPIESYYSDLWRLREISPNIMTLRLLGGEPLLNDNLGQYITKTREVFPGTDLRVCTNGLLIPKMKDGLVKILKENHVIFDITPYKPTAKYGAKIEQFLDDNGIIANFSCESKVELFDYCFTPERNNKDFHCMQDCLEVYKGRYSRCPLIMFLPKFNEKFEMKYPETGTYDLYEKDLNVYKFFENMNKRSELCDFCLLMKEYHNCTIYKHNWENLQGDEARKEYWLYMGNVNEETAR